jgi:hypothetical protein
MSFKDLQERNSPSSTEGHILLMFTKILLLAVDVACLAAAVGLHKFVDLIAERVIPAEWVPFRKLLTAAFAVAFSLIYIHLVFDMVLIFVPWFRRKPRSSGEGPAAQERGDAE